MGSGGDHLGGVEWKVWCEDQSNQNKTTQKYYKLK
jgi:hypothetical protein